MKVGHSAARCPSPRVMLRSTMEPGPSSGRPLSIDAFLPSRPHPAGQPFIPGCVAKVDTFGLHPEVIRDVLPRGLASRFGGTCRDYKLATFLPSAMAIFFPNWVIRESAIGRSPLRFEGTNFRISNWVEVGELGRGHLQQKAWIRLHHWPILCWNDDDVTAAIAGFGELWEIDPLSERRDDVSFLRARIRCQGVHLIPECLNLMVEDRRFRIPIEVESWEPANPILLGEDLDRRLGLESVEDQENFIRQTGFTSVPAMADQGETRPPRSTGSSGQRRQEEEPGRATRMRRPASGGSSNPDPASSNSNPTVQHPSQPYPANSEVSRGVDEPPRNSLLVNPDKSSLGPLKARSGPILTKESLRPALLGAPALPPLPLVDSMGLPPPPPLEDSMGVYLDGPNRPEPNVIADGPVPIQYCPPPHRSPSPPLLGPPQVACSPEPSVHLRSPSPPLMSPPQVVSSLKLNGSKPPLTICLRRSPRLAAKNRGHKKSSLQRAQDLMCRKLKLVRLASKAPRLLPASSASAPAATSNPAVAAVHLSPPLPRTLEESPLPSNSPQGIEVSSHLIAAVGAPTHLKAAVGPPAHLNVAVGAPAPSRDTASPLSPEEIQHIKNSCGIVDKGKQIVPSPTLHNPGAGSAVPGKADAAL